MLKNIIWDFNGTILDDLDLNFYIINILLSRRNLKCITKNEYLEFFNFPIKNYYEKLGFDFYKEPFEKVADEYFELYNKHKADLHLKEGVIDAFKLFKSKNIKQIILSASNKDYLTDHLNSLCISEYFDEILGLSDIYAHSKVELAKKWLKLSDIKTSESILIGDTVHDFEVARNTGINCILVCGGHNSETRIKETGATVIKSIKEGLDIISHFITS